MDKHRLSIMRKSLNLSKLRKITGEDETGVKLARLAIPYMEEGLTHTQAIRKIISPWIPNKWQTYSTELRENILNSYENENNL